MRVLTLAFILMPASFARADTALVAVAANFAGAADAISEAFAVDTDHTVQITTGSTGKLYAQITEGAPFDILLSADAKTPARLEAEGAAYPASVFTYAIGRLTLYSADPAAIGPDPKQSLQSGDVRFIAIANPDLAPYGQAAQETLMALGLWDTVQPKIVMGQNIGQVFALAQSGAADAAFVATSALVGQTGGSRWDVPQQLFAPIRQDAALLNAGADNPAAVAFLTYLKGEKARAIMVDFGYGLPDDPT